LEEVDLLVIFTLAHELSHDVVMIKEVKGLLPANQHHSKIFWEDFRDGDRSTLTYMASCLSPKNQQTLQNFVNPSIPNEKSQNTRYVYTPNIDPN